ncbi:MAG: transposase [Prevotellaceae bacterium]|nr:transposase [Prevotellaceae bacterium]
MRFHHAKKLKGFLDIHRNLTIRYFSPYSPDLNYVERVWWYMRKNNYTQSVYFIFI